MFYSRISVKRSICQYVDQMLIRYWVAIILLVLASLDVVLYTSDGDSDADLRFRYVYI